MDRKLRGECLCGRVKFVVENEFKAFYQCHCKQCQQLTGSAFAANIFTRPDNIEWLTGEDSVIHYEHPTRGFSKAFCGVCGSGVPEINNSATSLIIPAGALIDEPTIVPEANIFSSEQACWLADGLLAKKFTAFPE